MLPFKASTFFQSLFDLLKVFSKMVKEGEKLIYTKEGNTRVRKVMRTPEGSIRVKEGGISRV